ncbi:hypothetical protein DL96DRAFT_1690525 [Flagelloscypha sp. PMI_526]|nr:hypothetical protein DL96DRAFT_1690525 [Flagelloscypha sp. PMI_526]
MYPKFLKRLRKREKKEKSVPIQSESPSARIEAPTTHVTVSSVVTKSPISVTTETSKLPTTASSAPTTRAASSYAAASPRAVKSTEYSSSTSSSSAPRVARSTPTYSYDSYYKDLYDKSPDPYRGFKLRWPIDGAQTYRSSSTYRPSMRDPMSSCPSTHGVAQSPETCKTRSTFGHWPDALGYFKNGQRRKGEPVRSRGQLVGLHLLGAQVASQTTTSSPKVLTRVVDNPDGRYFFLGPYLILLILLMLEFQTVHIYF